MMTDIKYFLASLYGILLCIVIGVLVIQWDTLTEVPVALAAFSAMAGILVLGALSFIVKFFMTNWGKK